MLAMRSVAMSLQRGSLLDQNAVCRAAAIIHVRTFCTNSKYSEYEFDVVTDTDSPDHMIEKSRKKGMNSNYRVCATCIN